MSESEQESAGDVVEDVVDGIGDAAGGVMDVAGGGMGAIVGAVGGVADAMGMGGPEVAEDQEVEEESGAERMGKKIMLAMASPCFMLLFLIILGWNEKRAVCGAKAIIQGKETVTECKCTDTTCGDGGLIMFSCDLSKTDLAEAALPAPFASTKYTGVCLDVQSEMYQCYETVTSSTTKKKTGGGGTTTVKSYSYSKKWSSSTISSSGWSKTGSNPSKMRSACGASFTSNPAWPADLPTARQTTVAKAKVGAFTVPMKMLTWVKCKTDIPVSPLPAGWTASGGSWTQKGVSLAIGSTRVSFKTNSWAAADTMFTVLAKNTAGTMSDWTAPASWFCSGTTITDLRPGTLTKDELFKALEAENTAVTWILRFIGFLGLWCSCNCMLGPLEVLADCIPCIGPMLGDMVEAIICCITCPPAAFCCLGICAVVWIVMRPVMGALFLVAFCCFFISAGAYTMKKKNEKDEQKKGNKAASNTE